MGICVYQDSESGTCLIKHTNEQQGIAHFNLCIAFLYLVKAVIGNISISIPFSILWSPGFYCKWGEKIFWHY